MVDYVPELKGTNWDGIKMLDAANMATALQLEETLEAIIDPKRDFVGVYFSTNGYIPPYGEDRMPGYLRRAAKTLAGK